MFLRSKSFKNQVNARLLSKTWGTMTIMERKLMLGLDVSPAELW